MVTAEELLATYSKLQLADANEAETRLKLIDRVVFGVLGWRHEDVSVEERVSEDGLTTYADYVIRTGLTSLVIEAKKVGKSILEVPNKRKEKLGRKLVSAETGQSIIQARDYARKLGIPFAVVTNGSQWVVFPATRTDSVKFEDSSAIIFPNIFSALQDDYAEFSEILSRSEVIRGSLENELLGRIEDQIEIRRLNKFFPNNFTKVRRNSLFHIIEGAVTKAFTEDIVQNDPDLLEKCYVTTRDRTRFDRRIGMHITKRDSPSSRAPIKPLSPYGRKQLQSAIEQAADRTRPLALIVLGQVGAGKTTFINHMRWVSQKALFEPRADIAYPHWVYIDCRTLTPEESPLEFIINHMFAYAQEDDFMRGYDRCIRYAYKTDIEALEKGPLDLLAFDQGEQKRKIASFIMKEYEERRPYVEKIYSYCALNSPVFLVVDNVDQFQSEEFQATIFSDAMALAQRLRLNLILAMRDATYVAQKNKPSFDAFDFDPVYIEAPDIRAVLSRRFLVARALLQKQPAEFMAENGARVLLEDSSIIVDMLVDSVLGTEVEAVLSILATSDVRLALRMTREFLQYGYTATGKAIQIYQRTGKYQLPRHEAIRAIMLGNQSTYSEKLSVIGNPLDAQLSLTSAQLLRLFVLNGLVQRASTTSSAAIEGTVIKQVLNSLGYGDGMALRVLDDLCELRFIFTTSHAAASFEASFVPSRLGGYVVRHLLGTFVYLENIMVDTFISDGKVWEELKSLTEDVYRERDVVKKLRVRKERVRKFFNLMCTQYDEIRNEAQRRTLGMEWCGHPLRELNGALNRELERAMRSAEINYGQAASKSITTGK